MSWINSEITKTRLMERTRRRIQSETIRESLASLLEADVSPEDRHDR